jgi:hypothetical protein
MTVHESPDTLEDGFYYMSNCMDALKFYKDNKDFKMRVKVEGNCIVMGKNKYSFSDHIFYTPDDITED